MDNGDVASQHKTERIFFLETRRVVDFQNLKTCLWSYAIEREQRERERGGISREVEREIEGSREIERGRLRGQSPSLYLQKEIEVQKEIEEARGIEIEIERERGKEMDGVREGERWREGERASPHGAGVAAS